MMSNFTMTGIWDAMKLPGIALAATMLGFATMAREAGFTLMMTMASTAGIWGLPGKWLWLVYGQAVPALP